MTTTDTITLGNATITIDSVEYSRRTTDEGGDWLVGTMEVTWTAERGGQEFSVTASLSTGCWSDTDDDHAEWCAANEGARAINACLGLRDDGDTRGDFSRLAWPDECDSLGRAICAQLRQSAAI